MSSKADQIIQAIRTALTVPRMSTVQPDGIFLDLVNAIDQGTTLAIAIEEGDEPAPNLDGLIRTAERRINIDVHVVTKSSAPLRTADPALVESYNRIMADRTLGGLALDIQEGDTQRRRSAAERPVGAITKTYTVEFRTASHSLES